MLPVCAFRIAIADWGFAQSSTQMDRHTRSHDAGASLSIPLGKCDSTTKGLLSKDDSPPFILFQLRRCPCQTFLQKKTTTTWFLGRWGESPCCPSLAADRFACKINLFTVSHRLHACTGQHCSRVTECEGMCEAVHCAPLRHLLFGLARNRPQRSMSRDST